MKRLTTRFINKNRVSYFFFIGLFSLALAGASVGCSVSYPDGTIKCDTDSQCPGELLCVDGLCYRRTGSDAAGVSTGDAAAGDGSVSEDGASNANGGDLAGASGAGGAGGGSATCDGAVTQCEPNQCGTITDPCGSIIQCPECPQGYECRDGKQCRSGCKGCELGGRCYGPGFANPDNECLACSPTASVISWSPNANALCDDRKFCTESDQCSGDGKCGGKPRTCDDKCACTADPCEEAQGGCIHKSTCPGEKVCDCETNKCIQGCKDGECTIDGVCYKGGASNPTNACQVCDTKKNPKGWTLRAVGDECGGSAGDNPCSGNNICDKTGNCVPNRVKENEPCGDTNSTACSDPDTCDGKGNCLPNHQGTDVECDPASTCKLAGYCDGNGACTAGLFDSWARCDAPATPSDPKCSLGNSCNPYMSSCLPMPRSMGTLCNDRSPGVCENDDTCNAIGKCVDNGFKSVGTSCGESGDVCIARQCNRYHDCVDVNKPDGTSCGGEKNDGCAVEQCQNGQCKVVPAAGKEGQSCGQGGTGCAAKTCQSGKCAYAKTGTVCQEADRLCKLTSYCDGQGECDYKYQSTSQVCRAADKCRAETLCADKGVCPPVGPVLDKVCEAAKEGECVETRCSGGGDCNVTVPAHEGLPCGGQTSTPPCKKRTCVSGSCVTTDDDGIRECDENTTTCNDQCNAGACTPGAACPS
jgi:hypothetical protein